MNTLTVVAPLSPAAQYGNPELRGFRTGSMRRFSKPDQTGLDWVALEEHHRSNCDPETYQRSLEAAAAMRASSRAVGRGVTRSQA